MRLFRSALVFFAALAISACAYVLPASWRAFRVDPDDAAPAITTALDKRRLEVESYDVEKHRIVTKWQSLTVDGEKSRERFVVSWELDKRERALTVYVRHEAQDQRRESSGQLVWGAVYHRASREAALLDAISAEFVDGAEGMNLTPGSSTATASAS